MISDIDAALLITEYLYLNFVCQVIIFGYTSYIPMILSEPPASSMT
jgi:hypothetical protein